jgi:hypothetical protein
MLLFLASVFGLLVNFRKCIEINCNHIPYVHM